MRELIGRLEVTDDAVAGALRVIDHFDRLTEQRTSAAAVVRAAAALAGCPAGFHDTGRAITRRYGADGQAMSDAGKCPEGRAAVPGRSGVWVWLERTGEDGPLDALILERSARAIQTLTEGSAQGFAAAAVRIACDPDTSEADRRDAATRLGLAGAVTVVVTTAADSSEAHGTRIGAHLVTLTCHDPVPPPGRRVGTAVAAELRHLPAALERARVALRLTDRPGGPGPSLVAYDDLGALAALAGRFTPQEATAVGDVRRVDQVLTAHPWVIDTLQAVLDQASLRKAACELHVHHSTLQQRLSWLADQFGYSVARPGGRQRAAVVVLLWRIAHSEDGNTGTDA